MNATHATEASTRASLDGFVRDIGSITPGDSGFSQDAELFDSGSVDSLGIVSLTVYIEQQFGVTLSEEHLFDQGSRRLLAWRR